MLQFSAAVEPNCGVVYKRWWWRMLCSVWPDISTKWERRFTVLLVWEFCCFAQDICVLIVNCACNPLQKNQLKNMILKFRPAESSRLRGHSASSYSFNLAIMNPVYITAESYSKLNVSLFCKRFELYRICKILYTRRQTILRDVGTFCVGVASYCRQLLWQVFENRDSAREIFWNMNQLTEMQWSKDVYNVHSMRLIFCC